MKTITVGDCSFEVEPGPHLRFWNRVNRGHWEPETFAIFDRFIHADTLFVDVGAWIGSTALYGAQRASRCIAFEPDPVAFAELRQNLDCNAGKPWLDRLEIHDCAINKDGSSFTLGGSREGSDSMSSALFPGRDNQWTVRALRLPDVLAAHRAPGQRVFLKIDIEGGEYDLLPAISDVLSDPLVTGYISFHPRMLSRSIAPLNQPEQWKAPFVKHHLQVLASLPWTRQIATSDGTLVQRAALERGVRRRHNFPTELLISGP